VRTPPRILIADDNPTNVDILRARLAAHGYDIVTAGDGEAALAAARAGEPDVILLDVMMPKLDGFEVCRRLKADSDLPFMPIILVTARAESKDVITGLEAGADEYLTKPVDQGALVARVKSMLRIKALHDTVQAQAVRLEAQAVELREWNRTLEQRVADQVAELDRMARMRRFLSPQLAELVSGGEDKLLESHRREITVVFCDLRGFTAFAETAEPEDVMGVLREYHAALGRLIFAHEGTLERFAGDGVMVFYNDPIPCEDPTARAVRMAVAMRGEVADLVTRWARRGHKLGFGVGIAHGYATLGTIGFEGRFDYGAIGPVTNLAARLCEEAQAGEILLSERAYTSVEDEVETDPPRELALKGFHRSVVAYNVRRLRR
jgi:class 3 adenylate cyclase/AmiR/NasT family two-component response regulator